MYTSSGHRPDEQFSPACSFVPSVNIRWVLWFRNVSFCRRWACLVYNGWSVLRSVCWVEMLLRAQSGGMIALHCSTEHFLSENTVLLSSLTIKYEAKVPLGPCSKTASHSFKQSIEVVTQAASDWEGWSIPWLRRRAQSTSMNHFLSDLREIIEFRSTSLALVKLVEYWSSRKWHCLTSSIDSTSE